LTFVLEYANIDSVEVMAMEALFPTRLREARRKAGFTLVGFAEKYNQLFSQDNKNKGLNKCTLSRYENGKQEPVGGTIRNIADLLNVSTDYLLGKNDYQVSEICNTEFRGRNDSANLVLDNPASQSISNNIAAVNTTNGITVQGLSDEATVLLGIYQSLDLKRRIKLLDTAFNLDDEYKSKK
jgi:transcriptional regulator with XRE-family HTH domain